MTEQRSSITWFDVLVIAATVVTAMAIGFYIGRSF